MAENGQITAKNTPLMGLYCRNIDIVRKNDTKNMYRVYNTSIETYQPSTKKEEVKNMSKSRTTTKTKNPLTVEIKEVKEGKTMSKKEVKEVGVIKINLNTANDRVLFNNLATALSNIQDNAFEVGVISAYLNGVEIPSYINKNGVKVSNHKRNSMSITDIANHKDIEGYSRSTISRMVGAVKLIIDNNDFEKFTTTDSVRRLSFTYDKIYSYYQNKDVMNKEGIKSIDDAFKKSVRDLKDIVSKDKNGGTDSDTEEMVEFTYNRKKYNVKKSAMENFLKNCVKITK